MFPSCLVIWVMKIFLYSSSVCSCHLFLISSASIRSIWFLFFIVPIFAWNVPLVSLIFLKKSLVFHILLFSSISLHWSLKKDFLSLLAILFCISSKLEIAQRKYIKKPWYSNIYYKSRLLLGRKVMTNLDSLLKSTDITLPTKVHLIKAMVFPVIMYKCESWTIKKAESQRIDAFELWC